MFDSFRKLYRLLNRFEKRSFLILVTIIIFEALFEMLGIGIIPLFITSVEAFQLMRITVIKCAIAKR